MLDIDYEKLFEKTLDEGAVLLSHHLPLEELSILDSGCRMFESLKRRAPIYGALVMGMAQILGDPLIDPRSFSVQAYNPAKTPPRFHVDDQWHFGLSLLMPVTGPPADFYYSEVPQVYPTDISQATKYTYGPGDVVVLRQEVTVRRPDRLNQTHYDRVYHHGVAAEDRQLAVCDMIAPLVTLDETGE